MVQYLSSSMRTMANIVTDSAKFKEYEDERNCYYQLIRDRADIFKQEAAQVGLPHVTLPWWVL